MTTGVSYNVFNGEEHLMHSVRNMRSNVDHISLVVQYISNVGNPASDKLEHLIQELVAKKMVDFVYMYEPDLSVPASVNEHRKRSIGLEIAKEAGVSHFMTMDCDEYYPKAEFAKAKKYIQDNSIEASAVATFLHIKRPIWRSRTPDTTYCAFLTKITSESILELNSYYPVVVDPTRRLHGNAQRFHLFGPDLISMRHMNLVRNDLETKLSNSTNHHMNDFMNRVRRAYSEWEFGKQLRFPNKLPMDIIEVPDLFDIDKFFNGELGEYNTFQTNKSLLRRVKQWLDINLFK